MQPKNNASIEQRAYEIWEAEGRPHGKDLEHWERAARELGLHTPAPAVVKAKAAATAEKKPAARRGKAAPATEAPVTAEEAPKKRKASAPKAKAADAPAPTDKPVRARRTKKVESV